MRAGRGFVLASVLGALATACALIADIPDSVRTTCSRTIRVRAFSAIHSPEVADVAMPVYLGGIDSFREIKETGGIRGCPFEYEFTETDFTDPAKAVEIYEGWKTKADWKDVVAVFGVGSADALALGPKVTADKRVLISMAYNGTLTSPKPIQHTIDVPEVALNDATHELTETSLSQAVESKGFPYVFFPGTDYSTAIRTAVYQISLVSAGARVGWVHCATNEFCLNPLAAGKTYAKQLGLAIGRDVLPDLTDTGDRYVALLRDYFVSEATEAIANAGYKPVSWLWSGNLTAGTLFLAAALAAIADGPVPAGVDDATWQKARALAGATRIIANNYGFDESLAVGLCPRLPGGPKPCERIFGVMPFLAFGEKATSSTEMPKVVALHDKWRERDVDASANPAAPTSRSVRYVQGYMNAKLFKMAVERLFDQHKDITGENLKTALESFKSEDTGGITAPLSYTAADHRPQSTVSIYTLGFSGNAGTLVLVPPTRRIALEDAWLGW